MELDKSKFTAVMGNVIRVLRADPHHRLLSWDHAWEHWHHFAKKRDADESLAALHLAFYLASWGMYRGGADLLSRDYKVLIPVVRFLKDQAGEREWTDCLFDEALDQKKLAESLNELASDLSRVIEQKLLRPGKEKVNVSDTLLSKILLNTLGCVPAFDIEVKAALRHHLASAYSWGNGFHCRRLMPVIQLAQVNKKLVVSGQAHLEGETGKFYPLTKVLDLYLWYSGSELA